jgi:uncharacterized protein DUF3560
MKTFMNHPTPETLRAQAAQIEASAAAVSDSSEYPRVAKFVCNGQATALREYAETVETYGGEIPPKRAGMTGEERRERRATILRLRAARLKVKAAQHHRASHDIGAHIPFGQPILVGHHSERGHRRAIDRMHNQTRAAIAADDYARSLDSRADHVECSHAISASDSDAIDQYREKLARLTAQRDNMKAVNAAWRKFERTKNPSELEALGFDAHQIETLQLKIATAYSWEKQPFVKWQVSNLGAVIRDTQKKLAAAEARAAQPEQEIANEENGIRLEDSPSENRVRLYFPGKPAAEIRTQLKRNGFRWAPSLGCWQAFRNWHSQQHAAAVLDIPKN